MAEEKIYMDRKDITIALLIYASPQYLNFVMEGLLKNNSQEHNVNYLIVCNDASDDVIIEASKWASELSKNYNPKIRVVSHNNDDKEEYWLDRVYRAWNRCLLECNSEYICFVNSDMGFTPNWLSRLAKYDTSKCIPTSWLVESGRMPSIKGLVSKDFGQTISSFDDGAFQTFAKSISADEFAMGGAYMPSLFKTNMLRGVGGWSHNHNGIPGDKITFERLRRKYGLRHIMVKDSIVYHLQNGERVEAGDGKFGA